MILETSSTLFAVCKLPPAATIPAWAFGGSFFSVTRTADELSVVCAEAGVPAEQLAERGWRSFKVRGPLDFGLIGILSALSSPLAQAEISIFAISTFETDYLLVKDTNFERAVAVLARAGHEVRDGERESCS